jgi:response regulator RpfG family c-di-GMP phosphodiesterase
MASKTYQILVVDDELVNLRLMERLLRRDYQVVMANDGIEALEILKRGNISLLMSDQRMPGMTGIELLRQSHAIDPDLALMLVTANTDNDTSFEAINSAGALRVIHKPWDPRRVLQFVEEALAQRETLIDCKHANAQIEQVMILLRLAAENLNLSSEQDNNIPGESNPGARVLRDMFAQLEHNSVTVNKLTTKLLKEMGDRTRTEEELRLQQILLESQGEASLDGVLVVSVEGKIISFNQRFIELWGITSQIVASIRRSRVAGDSRQVGPS